MWKNSVPIQQIIQNAPQLPKDLPLTAENVEALFSICLYPYNEYRHYTKGLIIEGIRYNHYFCLKGHVIYKNQELIDSWVESLPKQFCQDYKKGGGWTFLNMCMKDDGSMWTDSIKAMEQLLVLGISIRRIKYLLPRFSWEMLPGKMPYVVIIKKEAKDENKKTYEERVKEIMDEERERHAAIAEQEMRRLLAKNNKKKKKKVQPEEEK